MTNLEKLAREICWRGFGGPHMQRQFGKTKAQYWRSLSDERRAHYARDAEWLMWLMKTLPVEMLASDYCDEKAK